MMSTHFQRLKGIYICLSASGSGYSSCNRKVPMESVIMFIFKYYPATSKYKQFLLELVTEGHIHK